MERIRSNGQSLVIVDYGAVIPGNSMHDRTTYKSIATFAGSSFDEVNTQIAEREGIAPFTVFDVNKVLSPRYRYANYKATDDLVDTYEAETAKRKAAQAREGQVLLQKVLNQFHEVNPAFRLLEGHGYKLTTSHETLEPHEAWQFVRVYVVNENGDKLAGGAFHVYFDRDGKTEIKLHDIKISY